jgi:hypothetical protein
VKKIRTVIHVCFAAVIAASCNSSSHQANTDETHIPLPKPGYVVAADSMEATSTDKLNHFVFTVKVIADSNIASGVYDVDADFGPNFATSQFTMPKGAETLTPILRKGSAPYTFIVGFKVKDDTTFYDYFEVSSNGHATIMQYIKAYTL